MTGVGVCLPGARDLSQLFRLLRGGAPAWGQERIGSHDYLVGRADASWSEQLSGCMLRRHFEESPRDVRLFLLALLTAGPRSESAGEDGRRLGIYDGTSRGPFIEWVGSGEVPDRAPRRERDIASAALGQAASRGALCLGARGPVETVSASCCSAVAALRGAVRDLDSGLIDQAFAGGHEAALCPAYLSGYRAAGLLVPPEHPEHFEAYGGVSGTVFGEGAVVFAVERRGSAVARGAAVLGVVRSIVSENHAAHPTHVEQRPEGLEPMMRRALEEAGATPSDVAVVVGHGNGVAASDGLEERSFQRVFAATETRLVANKQLVSHTIGASSAVNIAHCLLPGLVPPKGPRLCLALSMGIGGHQSATVIQPEQLS